MPDKCMAHDEHAVLFAKLDKTIRRRKIVPARFRMDQRPLQNVFRRDRIEVGRYDLSATRVFFEDLAPIKCGADLEIVLEDVLQ